MTVTSVNSIGSMPAELSSVSATSARPSAGRLAVPAKITSSIFWLRTELGACAPSTQAMASTTFDLPDPFGPTTTVTPGSSCSVVVSANDLKPLRVRDFRNTAVGRTYRAIAPLPRNAQRCASCRACVSVLAARAEAGGAAGRRRSAAIVGPAAGEAALAGAVVDPVRQLELAAVAVDVDVLRVGRASMPPASIASASTRWIVARAAR